MNLLYYSLVIIILSRQCVGDKAVHCTDSDVNLAYDSSGNQIICKQILNSKYANKEATADEQSYFMEFTCQSEGLFPDLTDSTCMRYFQCDKLNDGTLIKKFFKCPNSIFCSSTQKCSSLHICPCNETTNGLTSTSPSVISTTTIGINNPTEDIISTTTANHKTSEFTPTSSAFTSSTVHECTISSKEYECITGGRFPDFSDITCRNYFLCYKLRNGTFIKTPYDCKNSTFHPLILRCTTSYICPCNDYQTTGSEEFSTTAITSATERCSSEITTPSSNLSVSTTERDTTITTSPLLSTTKTSNNSNPAPMCSSSSDEFKCTTVGRFPDLTDFKCQKYLLCSQLRNGTFMKTEYQCPASSSFHPSAGKCSIEYMCPCTTTVSTPLTTDSINSSTVHSTSTIISSEVTTISSVASSINPVENITILTSALVSSTVSSNASNTTPACKVISSEFECTTGGRFPDFTDLTCQKYFLCSHLHNGSFIKTKYQCPKPSIFHPLPEKCSTKHVCPCISIKTTVSSSTKTSTTVETVATTTTISTISSEDPLENSTTEGVTTPISSAPTFTEGFTKVPTTTVAILTTTSYSCVPPSTDVPEFKCTSVGRFPDYTDVTCRKYYLCSKLQNGTFIKSSYDCPNTSCINASLQKCSSICRCPCT